MKFSHFDEEGRAKMADVTGKAVTEREAIARGSVLMKPETISLIKDKAIQKGDVITVAKTAAIMGAKKTWELVPMCHPLGITSVSVDIAVDAENSRVNINAEVKTIGQTGVEMEALTAVSVAALTVYDMCKSADKEMVISDIVLVEKRGGKSGEYRRNKTHCS
ncbi:MAG TPA: cyclic pyranopterin monophosphate synthase MoaC [Thermodesulfovibrionales bacterium]|nr:cyclic pyranopterin monophosphate synthase MoaC [Thermodesulfovibrionales bacterium]